jgi:Fe-S cluster assembly protein SufB
MSRTRRSTIRTMIYYSAPKPKKQLNSLDEVDPELLATFEKLGISLDEQKRLTASPSTPSSTASPWPPPSRKSCRDGHHLLLVLRSGAESSRAGQEVSRLGGALQRQLLRDPELRGLQRRLVLLHPQGRALPDGAVDLLPHQRKNTGQFERTLIIAEEGAYVSYLEGCTAPMRDENQLHAAVVELVASARTRRSSIRTVQNWYPGDKEGKGGIYNFVTKRGVPAATPRSPGRRSRPAPPSPGSIRAASCRATTRSASSTPSR